MSPEEVIKEIKDQVQVSISLKTLYNYEQGDLISKVAFKSSRKDYPIETPREVYAAWCFLRRSPRPSMDYIALIRERASCIGEKELNINNIYQEIQQDPDHQGLLFHEILKRTGMVLNQGLHIFFLDYVLRPKPDVVSQDHVELQSVAEKIKIKMAKMVLRDCRYWIEKTNEIAIPGEPRPEKKEKKVFSVNHGSRIYEVPKEEIEEIVSRL